MKDCTPSGLETIQMEDLVPFGRPKYDVLAEPSA